MRDKNKRVLLSTLKGRTVEICASSGALSEELDIALDRAVLTKKEAADAATAVSTISDNLSAVAATTEEFSVTMQQIREATRQSEDNIRVVSDSTGELATASTEIAQNTERARSVSSQAVSSVDFTLQQVTSLEEVAGEISNVTQVIHDISEQTKVLALNATIEAARAAEAGRGFAVVAREVKDLATETREATAFIRKKVLTIEESIASTITAIKNVSSVIGEVNEVVNNIAAAAEEQSISTQSIADNADMASSHFVEIAGAIDEGVTAMQDVSRSIAVSASQSQSASAAANAVSGHAVEIADRTTVSFAHLIEVVERLKDNLAELDLAGVMSDDSYTPGQGLFQFSKRFSVLVDSMDADHQKIFDYINQIHALTKNRGPVSEQARLFEELAAFTTEHFAREEELMAANQFPGLEQQQHEHRELLDRVDAYVEALQKGVEINMIAAMNFLNSWLINHIMKLDQQYGEYFKAEGIKA